MSYIIYSYFLFLLLILFEACNDAVQKVDRNNFVTYIFDNEDSKRKEIIIGDSVKIGPLKGLSNKYAHSGVNSIRLDSSYHYRCVIKLKNVRPNEFFIIEAWQKTTVKNQKHCFLVINEKKHFYHHSNKLFLTEKSGWKLTKCFFRIPSDYSGKEITIYAWNTSKNSIYVDDLKVTRYPNISTYNEAFNLDKIYLNIGKKELFHLDSLRNIRWNGTRPKRTKNDYVNATIVFAGDTAKGKVRLKGDLVDHLRDKKYSFRIKTKKPLVYGLKKFNVQAPDTRWMLNEYVYHKLISKENILCPKYSFVELIVNNESWGIYAFEEALSTQMVINANKPKGVILKFDDDKYWAETDKKKKNNLYSSVNIKSYGSKNAIEIEAAKKILKHRQVQDSSFFDDFDWDAMAKFYVLNEITKGYHALGWLNIRFYFNSDSQLMEPVGYDAYPGMGYALWANHFIGNPLEKSNDPFSVVGIVNKAITNPKVNYLVDDYVKKYAKKEYMSHFMESLEKEITFYEAELQKEYPYYKYDRDFLISNAVIFDSLYSITKKKK